MNFKHLVALTALVTGLACSNASAWDQNFWDQYSQRKDTITLGAGNAKDANAAIHVIDPWPRYVGNQRIPGNGERMAGAVERYRDVSKLPRAPRPITPALDRIIGIAGGAQQ